LHTDFFRDVAHGARDRQDYNQGDAVPISHEWGSGLNAESDFSIELHLSQRLWPNAVARISTPSASPMLMQPAVQYWLALLDSTLNSPARPKAWGLPLIACR
jgi:hypothetical protein